MKVVLTIAGSDSSGGAGIQADLKTMAANGVYGMSVLTALTAQNTTGVLDILEVPPTFFVHQIDAVMTDIPPDAIKVGMVSSADLIAILAERLRYYGSKNTVVDPVMVATSGAKLLKDEAIDAMKKHLFQQATLITPNIPEAAVLSGIVIETENDMAKAAKIISETFGCAVLCKGGHRISDANDKSDSSYANDVLYHGQSKRWFKTARVENQNTHGTGCTLSSAIAANLAKGYDLETSICRAKAYVTSALNAMLNLGHGSGPLNHAWQYVEEDGLK